MGYTEIWVVTTGLYDDYGSVCAFTSKELVGEFFAAERAAEAAKHADDVPPASWVEPGSAWWDEWNEPEVLFLYDAPPVKEPLYIYEAPPVDGTWETEQTEIGVWPHDLADMNEDRGDYVIVPEPCLTRGRSYPSRLRPAVPGVLAVRDLPGGIQVLGTEKAAVIARGEAMLAERRNDG